MIDADQSGPHPKRDPTPDAVIVSPQSNQGTSSELAEWESLATPEPSTRGGEEKAPDYCIDIAAVLDYPEEHHATTEDGNDSSSDGCSDEGWLGFDLPLEFMGNFGYWCDSEGCMERSVDFEGPDPLNRLRHVPQEHPPDVEVDTRDESKDLPGDTLVPSPVFDGGESMDVQGNQAHIVSRKAARRAKGKVFRIHNRQGRSRYVRSTGESCILTPEWNKMVCDWAGEEFWPELNPLPKFQADHASKRNLSSTPRRRQREKRMLMLTLDQKDRPMGYFVPWSDHRLFLHPKESDIAGIVQKCRWDGARGVIIVPVRTKETWFWSLGEVTVSCWDLTRDEAIFQDVHGGQHMQEPDTQYRAIAFDCLTDQQEGVNRTDWKRRPWYNLDSERGFDEDIGTPTSHKEQNIHSPRQRTPLFGKRPKGTDRKRWRLKCHKLAPLGQGPVDSQTLSWPGRVAH